MRRNGRALIGLGLLSLVLAGCDGSGGDAAGDTAGGADAVATDGGGDVAVGDVAPTQEVSDYPDAGEGDTLAAPDGEAPADVTPTPDGAVDAAPDATAPGDASDAGGETTGPAYVETRLDLVCVGERCAAGPDHVPDPDEFGPFPVGVKTIELWDDEPWFDEDAPRLLRTEIWYPTTDAYADGPYWEYDLATDAPPELDDVFAAVQIDGLQSHARRDAPLRVEDGPYPIVFFSHGAYGVRFQAVFLADKLASHGYVVIAADHTNNTTWDYLIDGYDPVNVMASGAERARDGEFLIDTFFDRAADPESEWYGNLATKRVGFTGHSFGGFLSIVMGARDDRIAAVVPLAPASNMATLSGVNLGVFPLPSLTMGGDLDRTLDFEPYMWNPYLTMPRPKAFVRFYRGGHYTFTDMCSVDVVALAEELGWGDAEDALSDGCGEENFDPATARGITAYYTIAFLNAHLRQSWASLDLVSDERIAAYEGDVELFRAFEPAQQ